MVANENSPSSKKQSVVGTGNDERSKFGSDVTSVVFEQRPKIVRFCSTTDDVEVLFVLLMLSLNESDPAVGNSGQEI